MERKMTTRRIATAIFTVSTLGLSASAEPSATAMTRAAPRFLESVLAALEAAQPPRAIRFVRDPERYFFSVFGTPSTHSSWGWRVEGHHVSLHFTVVDGSLVAGAPSFFGANPAEVRAGPKQGTRVLGPEEDVAPAPV